MCFLMLLGRGGGGGAQFSVQKVHKCLTAALITIMKLLYLIQSLKNVVKISFEL